MYMTVNEVLQVLPSNVCVRVNVAGVGEFSGETGHVKSKRLMKQLSEAGCDNATVVSVYPLWHARELYMSCLKC